MTETCAAADTYASALREVTRSNNAVSVNMEVEGDNEAEGKGEGEGNAKVSAQQNWGKRFSGQFDFYTVYNLNKCNG